MNLFLTGASGYIGGSVATKLLSQGHRIRGLVRDPIKGNLLQERGIDPVIGDLDDSDILTREAASADGVINTANADHQSSVEVMLRALEGTGKLFVHTSGSSVVGDDARGNHVTEKIYDEATPFDVAAAKQARDLLNKEILASSSKDIRTVVICPTLIYGDGSGLNRHSIQIPFLFDEAVRNGRARVVGKGLNRWSTVHIDDLVDLYSLVVISAPPGAFYFAEDGEVSFRELATAISARLGLSSDIESLDPDVAAAQWGNAKAYYTFGSNSRVRALRARTELGWAPVRQSALTWIQTDMINHKENGTP